MLMLLGRGVARCSAYALQAGRAVRQRSTRAPRIRATAADEVDLPYRGVLADLRLPDSLTDEDAFDAWAAEREARWTRHGAPSHQSRRVLPVSQKQVTTKHSSERHKLLKLFKFHILLHDNKR